MKAGNNRVLVCSSESLLASATNTSTVKRRTESWLSWDNFSNNGSTSSGEIWPTRFYKKKKESSHFSLEPKRWIDTKHTYHQCLCSRSSHHWTIILCQLLEQTTHTRNQTSNQWVNNTSYLRLQLLLERLRGFLQDCNIETCSWSSAGEPITHSKSLEKRNKVFFKMLLG